MIWVVFSISAVFFILLAQFPLQKLLIATNHGLKNRQITPYKMRPLGFFTLNAKLEAIFLLFYELCLPLVSFSILYQIMPMYLYAISASLLVILSYQFYHKRSFNLHPLTLLVGAYLVIDSQSFLCAFILSACVFYWQKKSALSLLCFLSLSPLLVFALNNNPWLSAFSLAINLFYLYSYRVPLLNTKADNPWSLRGWI